MAFLYEGAAWDADLLRRVYDAIEPIARDELGLDVYPNQRQVVSSEQMLDAYASVGMPSMYKHWSFGKKFAREDALYRRGMRELAYELVINSNPCISFYLEDSTATMQTLTTAHAAFGHNHFFKNNYLFKEWTDAGSVLDYLQFAQGYVAKCEDRYGIEAVEHILDAAHALMPQGVFRAKRSPPLSYSKQIERAKARRHYEAERFNELWYRTVPQSPVGEDEEEYTSLSDGKRPMPLRLPEENILYFLEKNSPSLDGWQRELLRIVRSIAQYFHPQRQTKVMNEGCATFVHHYIMNRLWEKGLLPESAMLEFADMHSMVITQPEFDDPRFTGFNPYKLGFEMMCDIRRMCENPTEEDLHYVPSLVGKTDWRAALREAWAEHRDESFILQYLSPKLMRDMRLFSLSRVEGERHVTVEHIHDPHGYRHVRRTLAGMYDAGRSDPDIQVVGADLRGDRTLKLRYHVVDGSRLADDDAKKVMQYLTRLWRYPILLEYAHEDGKVRDGFSATPDSGVKRI